MNPFSNPDLARARAAEWHRQSAERRTTRRQQNVGGRRPAKRERAAAPPQLDGQLRNFAGWVRSLPWVVERPYELAPGVRTFAIDCPQLAIRRPWLVVGIGAGADETAAISVIVPAAVADAAELGRWGRRVAGMPGDQVLMSIGVIADHMPADLEARVLTCYWHAMR